MMALPAPKFSCSDLLSHVQKIESSLPPLENAYFGHPPPPVLHMAQVPVQISGAVYLLAAQTSRSVSIQLWMYSNDGSDVVSSGNPVEAVRLAPVEDEVSEEITCATILNLEPTLRPIDAEQEIATRAAAIVLGTNLTRVLAVQIQIQVSAQGTGTVHCDNGQAPFEPAPLDPLDSVDEDKSVADSLVTSRHGGHSIADTLAASPHGGAGGKFTDRRHGSLNHSTCAFHPEGGVVDLAAYVMSDPRQNGLKTTLVWISYRDGTILRLHNSSFFPPAIVDEALAKHVTNATLRIQVALPISYSAKEGATFVPLPKYYPSPLAPLVQTRDVSDFPTDEVDTRMEDTVPGFHEALAFGGNGTAASGNDHLPVLTFFTSEDQFAGRIARKGDQNREDLNQDGDLVGNVVGGTKAIVGGVLGAAFGAVKWGLGAGKHEELETDGGDGERKPEDRHLESTVQTALHGRPQNLFAGFEVHDAPRQISSVKIDPRGTLAVATDNLGRVLLIDLSSKQIVRTWKGARDAACCWIEQPGGASRQSKTFLAILSRQRGVLEIWRCRYGPKVMTRKVARDAEMVQCNEGSSTSCYLVQPSPSGTSASKIDPLDFDETDFTETGVKKTSSANVRPRDTNKPLGHESAMRLQLLRQLLAKTQVPCEAHDVFEAFTQITAPNDLLAALDVLAEADQLEDSMGVEGSEFHASAVSHCKVVLEQTIKNAGSSAKDSALVKVFESRIVYHAQLVEAYETLRKFESKDVGAAGEEDRVSPSSPWAIEGMSWLTTYEAVSGSDIDAGIAPPDREILRFSSLAKACSSTGVLTGDSTGRHRIYFTGSPKVRTEVLVHVFGPLLRDVFKLKVVASVFRSLGVSFKDRGDIAYLLKCFGDWFMSTSAREAARGSFFVAYSPILRWLHDMASNELSVIVGSIPEGEDVVVLQALHVFCSESADLVRAFLLASLGHEAVSSASKKKEDRTYGLVSKSKAVTPWKQLLRKLRVCLLVSLRLHGLHVGAFPITVKNVEADDIFSVCKWLAQDELRMSHRQDEILSLEKACLMSGLSFDPSTEVGDSPKRLKLLHQSCLASAITEAEREEYMLDMNDDDLLGALLLFLKHHIAPMLMVAHRALLLASEWHQTPSKISILDDCLDALKGFDDDSNNSVSLRTGVILDVWESVIRPVYRALFFGFDDVHELDRESVAPLLEDKLFVQRLGQRSLVLLNLLSATLSKAGNALAWHASEAPETGGWPTVREDFILKGIVDRMLPINKKTLDTHRVIICGTLLSTDLHSLSECVPDIFSAFLPASLFAPLGEGTPDGEKQMDFLEHAVVSRAKEIQRSTFMDRLDLGEIEILANLWDVDLRDVRTMFVLVMYELGKDSLVDQQLTMSTERNMQLDRLIEDGVGIACRRLNHVLGNRSPQVRGIIGLLDADTCEWVREEAEMSEALAEETGDVEASLSSTHLLVLRLLSLASTAGNKQNLVKIHSLSILSGSLMKAMEPKR